MRTPTHVSQVTSSQQLRSKQFGPLPWLWDGYLTPFALTLMTSRWKTGKTTLLTAFVAKMEAGGQFAGSALRTGRVLIVTEEDQRIWARRQSKFRLGDHISWIFRPFVGPPTLDEWLEFMKQVRSRQRYRPADLLVIDPLATIFPSASDRNPEMLLAALAPLRTLASRGVAVLLLHHPRKGRRAESIEPRGTGVLPSTVDILIQLERMENASPVDRRRWLRAQSRFEETPVERLIELNEAGTDYFVLNPINASDFESGWPILKTVFEDANHRLTRHAILAAWPKDYDKPGATTLWHWLDRAVVDGLIARKGQGRKSDPFLYWLPGREFFLLPDLPPLEPLEWGRVLEADRLAEEFLEEAVRGRRRRG